MKKPGVIIQFIASDDDTKIKDLILDYMDKFFSSTCKGQIEISFRDIRDYWKLANHKKIFYNVYFNNQTEKPVKKNYRFTRSS